MNAPLICVMSAAVVQTLAGCASHTRHVHSTEVPSQKLAAVCVDQPNAAHSLPIRISEQGTREVNDWTKEEAKKRVQFAVSTYLKAFQPRMIAALQAQGVSAVPCDPPPKDGRDKISAYITGAEVDRTMLGYKTQIRISVRLNSWFSPGLGCSAQIMSGNTMPSPMMVDEKNVDTLATEVLHQLRESGWMASK